MNYPDTEFRAKARDLQSKWREEKGYSKGRSRIILKDSNNNILRDSDGNCRYRYSSKCRSDYIDENDADKYGYNFLSEKTRDVARKEIEKGTILDMNDGIYRFKCNLLSSQPLCFNLFGEFLDRKDILVEIFNKLKSNLMDKITEIKFEYSPGRRDKKYTGDRTAFDVFIEYEKDNKKLFLGMEVKYSESLQEETIKKAEENFIYHGKRYKEITETCGLFKSDVIDKIKVPPYSQIWRDHLLSISLKNCEDKIYNNGYYIFLYPSNNPECCCGIKKYMGFLRNPEESIFELHLEDFIKTIKENVNEDWANELLHRYIEGL